MDGRSLTKESGQRLGGFEELGGRDGIIVAGIYGHVHERSPQRIEPCTTSRIGDVRRDRHASEQDTKIGRGLVKRCDLGP